MFISCEEKILHILGELIIAGLSVFSEQIRRGWKNNTPPKQLLR